MINNTYARKISRLSNLPESVILRVLDACVAQMSIDVLNGKPIITFLGEVITFEGHSFAIKPNELIDAILNKDDVYEDLLVDFLKTI